MTIFVLPERDATICTSFRIPDTECLSSAKSPVAAQGFVGPSACRSRAAKFIKQSLRVLTMNLARLLRIGYLGAHQACNS